MFLNLNGISERGKFFLKRSTILDFSREGVGRKQMFTSFWYIVRPVGMTLYGDYKTMCSTSPLLKKKLEKKSCGSLKKNPFLLITIDPI